MIQRFMLLCSIVMVQLPCAAGNCAAGAHSVRGDVHAGKAAGVAPGRQPGRGGGARQLGLDLSGRSARVVRAGQGADWPVGMLEAAGTMCPVSHVLHHSFGAVQGADLGLQHQKNIQRTSSKAANISQSFPMFRPPTRSLIDSLLAQSRAQASGCCTRRSGRRRCCREMFSCIYATVDVFTCPFVTCCLPAQPRAQILGCYTRRTGRRRFCMDAGM